MNLLEGLVSRLPVTRALQSRSFTLLLVGQTISVLGDIVFDVALTWEVLLLTGSAAALGIVLTATVIPRLLFLLVGGAVADRIPRRLVLLLSDAGRGIVVLLVAILGWTHLLQFWHLVALGLLFGLVEGFFLPAYESVIPQLVVADALPSANALRSLGMKQSRLLGALLGASIIALAGPVGAFAFDSITFGISVLTLLVLQIPKEQSAQSLQHLEGYINSEQGEAEAMPLDGAKGKDRGRIFQEVYRDIGEGLHYVMRMHWLWIMILVASVGNMVLDATLSLAVPKLILNVYELSVWWYGALRTAGAIGAIIGTLLVGQIPHLRRRGLFVNLAAIISGVALIGFGLPLPRSSIPIVSACANFFVGFGLGAFQVIWVTLLQEFVPGDKLGRVNSIDALGSYSLFPLGYLFIGVLIDRIGPAWIIIANGSIFIALSCLALSVRSVRQLN